MEGAPGGHLPQRFQRTWAVTTKRWGRAWIAFAGVCSAFGLLAAAIAPNNGSSSTPFESGQLVGTVVGLAVAYLLMVGWWLDHVLASSGPVASMVVQGVATSFVALISMSSSQQNYGSSAGPTAPMWLLCAAGLVSVIVADRVTRGIPGSFPDK